MKGIAFLSAIQRREKDVAPKLLPVKELIIQAATKLIMACAGISQLKFCVL